MGMKALIVIEIKTRLIEVGKELDKLVKLVEKENPEIQGDYRERLEELRLRYKELEDDHDLMRLFDESEWGRFDQTMNTAIQKLSRDVSAARNAVEAPLVPA